MLTKSKSNDGEGMHEEIFFTPGMSDRFIWVTEFNSHSLLAFYRKFSQLENDPSVGIIPIIIDSYGGEIYALNGMISLIKTSKKKVLTVTMSKAKSCGLSLLAAGSKGLRFISPYAEVLYHEAAYFAGYDKVTDHEASAVTSRRLSDKLMKQLSDDSGTSVEKIRQLLKDAGNADLQFTAEEAVKLGFADHIGMPSISIDPPQWVVGTKMTEKEYDKMEAEIEQKMNERNNKKPKKVAKNGKKTRTKKA